MTDYSSAEVCQLLQWPASRLYAYVRDGLVQPRRQGRGYRFTFSDLIVLRAANQLLSRRVPASRVRRALRMLAQRLASNRPLSTLSLTAVGQQIAFREGDRLWEVESGQGQIDFESPGAEVVPVRPPAGGETPGEPEPDFSDDYNQALELEADDPDAAAALYRRVIEQDDRYADAHINLGRLLQQAGDHAGAEQHYERALTIEPGNALAHFNLGTLMEDMQRLESAEAHYLQATGRIADAHLNLARLYASWGDTRKAIRHLRTVRFWSEPDEP